MVECNQFNSLNEELNRIDEEDELRKNECEKIVFNDFSKGIKNMDKVVFEIYKEIYFFISTEIEINNNTKSNRLFKLEINNSFACIGHQFHTLNGEVEFATKMTCIMCKNIMVNRDYIYRLMDSVYEVLNYNKSKFLKIFTKRSYQLLNLSDEKDSTKCNKKKKGKTEKKDKKSKNESKIEDIEDTPLSIEDRIIESWKQFSRIQSKYQIDDKIMESCIMGVYSCIIDVVELKLSSNTWFETFNDFVLATYVLMDKVQWLPI